MTKKGLLKLQKLQERDKQISAFKNYTMLPSGTSVVISFDIPEKERRKRDWLRFALKQLNFHMIQKSVWWGKTKIPKEFIDCLKELKIIDYVEIFRVIKSASSGRII